MKTILVVYTDQKLSVEQINSRKMQKYCFRTENEVEVGDVLKFKGYTNNMVVTDVVDADYKYYNAQSGEMTYTINSTKCYPIETLVLREEDENVIYATKVTNSEKA
jgi:hypothetical protein